MPTHGISLRDFKLLNRIRTKALSFLRSIPNSTATPLLEQEESAGDDDDDSSSKPQQHQQSNTYHSQSQPNAEAPDIANSHTNPRCPCFLLDHQKQSIRLQHRLRLWILIRLLQNLRCLIVELAAVEKNVMEEPAAMVSSEAKMEVKNELDIPTDKVKRKKELEKKLEILNERKHQLVQALKQILNAEEEMMRRNSIHTAVGHATVPLQVEAQAGTKMGSEANVGGDLEGESEDASNHNTHARPLLQMHLSIHGFSS